MQKPGALGRVCLVLLTDLIIQDGGKLVCQLFFGGKWLMASGLGEILRGEGVDNSGQWSMVRILTSKGVLPGVKTPDSMEGLIAQAKAWAYLRNNGKDKARG